MSFVSKRAPRKTIYHIKMGNHLHSLRVLKRVHTEISNMVSRYKDNSVKDPKRRIVLRLGEDLRKLCDGLDGSDEADNETMDRLELAACGVRNAAREYGAKLEDGVPLDVPNARAFAEKCAVTKLAAIRGLDSKEAYAAFLKHVDVVAEWRRERAAFFKERREEGYTDRQGKKHSPAEIAAKAEHGRQRDADPTGRDVSLASRTSAGGRGLQDTEANDESMRETQDRRARRRARDPHRQRTAIDAAHAARNALPPPTGAERHVDGYIVCSYIAQGQQQRPTWSHAEIVGRVADLRERNGVPELDRSKFGTHVHEVDSGWRVRPPARLLRPLKLKDTTTSIYCPETRSCAFPDEDEAVVAYEKFMAPSTSNDERKAMMHLPRDAFICAHCGGRFFSKKQSAGVRMRTRQNHERSCAERSSSSEEEESDEDESEEESDEDDSEEDETEEVVTPPPKRSRFSWPLW